ncbi:MULTISPECIES: AMP-binding protein [unclassified Streptomyces]|uniref:class I adenylate-forming enzyme family protein n=1 Tax=unclassified Streptomyces TaxID=2593676 RepID=UPI0023653C20|nr:MULTISPECIES: AMP-binding protein [unclassified Streptomyces]MDF3145140.1 AMP-binding protein [Streptomyces sp. T21Q-yed]WDF35851.1 AMP-binding protein [Streptomyces sp. T12]
MNALNRPGDIVPYAASRYADKTALVTPTRTLTFAELDDLTSRAANGLRRRGITPGRTVSLYGPNSWQWIVAYHAILRAGAVVNPINVMLTPPEVAFVLNDCQAVAVLTAAERLPDLRTLTSEIDSVQCVLALDGTDEDAFSRPFAEEPLEQPTLVEPTSLSTIGYTSVTTGHPKGAMQSHRAVLLNCALTATMHGHTSRDVVVTALPATHVYGNVAINGTLLAGGTVVLMERFAPDQALALISEHRATMFEGVPAMYAMLLAEPAVREADLTSLDRCTVGGQTIAESTIEAWEQRSGAPLIELWGMTEISGLGTTHAIDAPPVHGSIGISLPGLEVRVADLGDATRDAPVGEPGELMVRGPLVMMGYYGNPTETKKTIEPDGWLHTGDIAYADDSGHFFVVDRRKDLIITAGYNVYPAEIERVISAHPAVAMVGVGAVTDDVKGELACACIVLRAGMKLSEEEILDFTRDRLAAYKRPCRVVFVSSLPTTSSGKIMRRKLLEAPRAEA